MFLGDDVGSFTFEALQKGGEVRRPGVVQEEVLVVGGAPVAPGCPKGAQVGPAGGRREVLTVWRPGLGAGVEYVSEYYIILLFELFAPALESEGIGLSFTIFELAFLFFHFPGLGRGQLYFPFFLLH